MSTAAVPTRSMMRSVLAGAPELGQFPRVAVRFWRNCAVEHLDLPLRFFAAVGGLDIAATAGIYDDSLSFAGLAVTSSSADAEVIVVERDRVRLSDDEFDRWLAERSTWLTEACATPVVSVVVRSESAPTLEILVGGVRQWTLTDRTLINVAGSNQAGGLLGPRGFTTVARELALRWFPAVHGPVRKLLAVDLDETLHRGVLGEMGLDVEVTEAHKALQHELLLAKERGFLLALVTKNESADVLELLDNHPDYLVRRNDFVAIEASWDPKPTAVARVMAKTHLGAEAIVLVDDNLAELAQMSVSMPDVGLVSCATGPTDAVRALQYTSGYRTLHDDALGGTRAKDILSDADREPLIVKGLDRYFEDARPVVHVSQPAT